MFKETLQLCAILAAAGASYIAGAYGALKGIEATEAYLAKIKAKKARSPVEYVDDAWIASKEAINVAAERVSESCTKVYNSVRS